MDAHSNYTQPPSQAGQEQPSIGDLIRRLVEDTGHLFRTELKLAQAELRQNMANARMPILAIAFGMLLCLAALFTLLAAIVAWLTPVLGAGGAALLVAVLTAGAGLALMLFGKKQLDESNIAPTRTVASLKQDAQALKGNHT